MAAKVSHRRFHLFRSAFRAVFQPLSAKKLGIN